MNEKAGGEYRNRQKILVTLTTAESKRLIAKYVAQMMAVQHAMKEGILVLQLSSTNGYIYEELSGTRIDKSAYLCGFLSGAGGCGAYLPGGNKRECYFEKGEKKYLNFPSDNFEGLFQRMGAADMIIKSGNLLDRNGKAGVFVGEPSGDGGEWGKAYKYVKKNGIQVVVPMTLNKSANVTVEQVTDLVKLKELNWSKTHVMADMVILPGRVITEIDALRGFFGVEAIPVAMNGVSSGEGTVTLCIFGEKKAVDKSWDLITSIKGEPPLEAEPRCGTCLALQNQGICVAQRRIFTRT